MLIIGGTRSSDVNVLNGTKLQTLYRKARMRISAVARVTNITAAAPTATFESADKSLMTTVKVPQQQTIAGAGGSVTPIRPQVMYDGEVPAGQLVLRFTADVDWEAMLY